MPVESTSETTETLAGATVAGSGVESGSAYRSTGADSTSDIGQAEAYITQIKRLVAEELDFDNALRRIHVQDAQAAADHANRVRLMAEQALANLIQNSNGSHQEGRENSRFGFDQLYPALSNVVSDALAAKVAGVKTGDDKDE